MSVDSYVFLVLLPHCRTLMEHSLEHCVLFTGISPLLNRSDCCIGSHINFLAACQNIDAEFVSCGKFTHFPPPFYFSFCNKCLHWKAGRVINSNYWSHGRYFKAVMNMLEALGYETCLKQCYCITSLLVCCTAMQAKCANAHKHSDCKCGVVFLVIFWVCIHEELTAVSEISFWTMKPKRHMKADHSQRSPFRLISETIFCQ